MDLISQSRFRAGLAQMIACQNFAPNAGVVLSAVQIRAISD
jgi:hypothetical protein